MILFLAIFIYNNGPYPESNPKPLLDWCPGKWMRLLQADVISNLIVCIFFFYFSMFVFGVGVGMGVDVMGWCVILIGRDQN